MGSSTNGHGSTPNEDIVSERLLDCKLTEPELLVKGDRMAECELEADAVKLRRNELNSEIRKYNTERAKLAHEIDNKVERRTVFCKWIQDFEHNVWRLMRQDTGEEVETRTMTGADRQEALDFDAEYNAEQAKAAEAAAAGKGKKPRAPKPRKPKEAKPGKAIKAKGGKLAAKPKSKAPPKGKKPPSKRSIQHAHA